MMTWEVLPPLPHPLPLDAIHEARLRGFGEGWDARQPEVDRLNDECDRLWLQRWEPRKRGRIVRQRIDAHFVAEERRFYGRGGGHRG